MPEFRFFCAPLQRFLSSRIMFLKKSLISVNSASVASSCLYTSYSMCVWVADMGTQR